MVAPERATLLVDLHAAYIEKTSKVGTGMPRFYHPSKIDRRW